MVMTYISYHVMTDYEKTFHKPYNLLEIQFVGTKLNFKLLTFPEKCKFQFCSVLNNKNSCLPFILFSLPAQEVIIHNQKGLKTFNS